MIKSKAEWATHYAEQLAQSRAECEALRQRFAKLWIAAEKALPCIDGYAEHDEMQSALRSLAQYDERRAK